MVEFVFATSGNEVIGNFQGGRKEQSRLSASGKVSTHFIHSVPAVRRDPQQTKGESLLAVALF
jgi:hypothetical protein